MECHFVNQIHRALISPACQGHSEGHPDDSQKVIQNLMKIVLSVDYIPNTLNRLEPSLLWPTVKQKIL